MRVQAKHTRSVHLKNSALGLGFTLTVVVKFLATERLWQDESSCDQLFLRE